MSVNKPMIRSLFVISILSGNVVQAMDQEQTSDQECDRAPVSMTPVEACLSDLQEIKNIARREADQMVTYSTKLENGNWVSASKSLQNKTHLVFYTRKQNNQNLCTPIYHEHAHRIYTFLDGIAREASKKS